MPDRNPNKNRGPPRRPSAMYILKIPDVVFQSSQPCPEVGGHLGGVLHIREGHKVVIPGRMESNRADEACHFGHLDERVKIIFPGTDHEIQSKHLLTSSTVSAYHKSSRPARGRRITKQMPRVRRDSLSLAAFCIYVMAQSLVCCPPRAEPRLPLDGGAAPGFRLRFVYGYRISDQFEKHLKGI